MSAQTKRQFLMLAAGFVVLLLLWWAQGGGNQDETAGSTSSGSSGSSASAPRSTGGTSADSLPTIAQDDLPPEARETLRDIESGGPYDYPGKDDTIFGNREGILPSKPNGYYREYTVITPGSDDRGARRIVAGRDGDWYYTADHYESFSRIEGH